MLDIFSLNDVAINLFLNAILHFKDQISITTAVILVHHIISPLVSNCFLFHIMSLEL